MAVTRSAGYLHPRDPDTPWVFPMKATPVWPHTSSDGKPATYITRNAAKVSRRSMVGHLAAPIAASNPT